ncbi:unnamed protein product, partial [Staurois parvus]
MISVLIPSQGCRLLALLSSVSVTAQVAFPYLHVISCDWTQLI